MLADFFTKPLQGSLFRKFRAVLLGEEHVYTLVCNKLTVSFEERVVRNMSFTEGTDGQTKRDVESHKIARPSAVSTYADVVKNEMRGSNLKRNDEPLILRS